MCFKLRRDGITWNISSQYNLLLSPLLQILASPLERLRLLVLYVYGFNYKMLDIINIVIIMIQVI